jgi:hypothetical protein
MASTFVQRAARNRIAGASRAIVAMLAGMLFSAQATAQGKPTPITDATPALESGWASVQPPRGSQWYLLDRSGPNAVFGKYLGSPRHTMMATVVLRTLPGCCAGADELLAMTRKYMTEDRANARYRFVSQDAEVVEWNGMACVASRIVAEDRGVPFAPGEAFNFFQRGLTCLGPAPPGAILDVTYSERGGPPEGTPALVEEGERFLKGVGIR